MYKLPITQISIFRHFGQFGHFRFTEFGQKYQKAHLGIETFNLSPKSSFYDFPLKSYSLYKKR